MRKKLPELVLPAGDLHRARIAFLYGADAVYIGLDKYSLRKAEVRFSIPEIKKAIELAHSQKKKIYITFNIFAHNKHLESLARDMRAIGKFSPDAFIISDPGIISIAKKTASQIPVHLSTQANTINSEAVRFWQKLGIKRIVLGREVTLTEIKEIKKAVPKMELEIFVHGAMCISYSGRCLMSAALTGRSANLGECAQPCRWQYKVRQSCHCEEFATKQSSRSPRFARDDRYFLEEAKRPGEFYPIEEDSHGTYIMNSKDLCLIEHLDKILNAGVSALKIEGRNKTDFYVATVARAYRKALGSVTSSQGLVTRKKEIINHKKELLSLTHRGYTTGFLFGDGRKGETFSKREPILGKRYLGFVESSKSLKVGPPTLSEYISKIVVKNKLEVGKPYELLTPDKIIRFKISKMLDKNRGSILEAHPGRTNEKVYIKTDKNLPENTFIRSTN